MDRLNMFDSLPNSKKEYDYIRRIPKDDFYMRTNLHIETFIECLEEAKKANLKNNKCDWLCGTPVEDKPEGYYCPSCKSFIRRGDVISELVINLWKNYIGKRKVIDRICDEGKIVVEMIDLMSTAFNNRYDIPIWEATGAMMCDATIAELKKEYYGYDNEVCDEKDKRPDFIIEDRYLKTRMDIYALLEAIKEIKASSFVSKDLVHIVCGRPVELENGRIICRHCFSGLFYGKTAVSSIIYKIYDKYRRVLGSEFEDREVEELTTIINRVIELNKLKDLSEEDPIKLYEYMIATLSKAYRV